MKRWLFEIHRWVGIALALFMTLWFVSGLVIVFAEPVTPTRAQQLAHSESLNVESGWFSAGEAWERSAEARKAFAKARAPAKAPLNGAAKGAANGGQTTDLFLDARLVRQAGEPLWLVEDRRGQRFALSARDGSLHLTSPEQAERIAQKWYAPSAPQPIHFVETIDKPAILRNQENLRPFHRIAIDDGSGSELLISAVSGEVVSASTQFERALYWTGNWIHLFRPLELTSFGESRTDVLKWVSFAAVIATLTGLIIGWLRWRPGLFGKPTYSEGRTQPYRHFWLKWHFWAGLTGGLFALAWGVSGFFNGNPWQLFSPATPSREALVRYVGDVVPAVVRDWRPSLRPDETDGRAVVELNWRRLGDQAVLLAYTRDGRRLTQEVAGAAPIFGQSALIPAIERLTGKSAIATQTVITEYDSYYYLRHHRDAADRPLPVVRVQLDDAEGTQIYLDPQDGRMLLKIDESRKVFRWLYSALHHWDFGWLYHRPFWDGWMVAWVTLGLVLSISSVVIGWRRLRIAFARKESKRAAAPALDLATENRTI